MKDTAIGELLKHTNKLVEKLPTRFLTPLYWVVLAFFGLMEMAHEFWWGLLVLGGPVALVFRVSRRGLAGTHWLLMLLAIPGLYAAASLLDSWKTPDEYPSYPLQITWQTVLVIFVLVMLVSGFLRVVKQTERHYWQRHPAAEPWQTEEFLRYGDSRLNILRLFVTTTALVVASNPVAMLCLLALWRRGRLTAYLACVTTALIGCLSFTTGHLNFGWFTFAAGILSSRAWLVAARNPYWSHRARG